MHQSRPFNKNRAWLALDNWIRTNGVRHKFVLSVFLCLLNDAEEDLISCFDLFLLSPGPCVKYFLINLFSVC